MESKCHIFFNFELCVLLGYNSQKEKMTNTQIVNEYVEGFDSTC